MKNSEVILITGCSSGIGRALCEALYDQGYVVVATARNIDSIKEVKATLKYSLDVTNVELIDEVVSKIKNVYGKIDVLVNNAGYSVRGALEEVPLPCVKAMYEVNVFGIINMLQSVIPVMRQQNSGKIINIGSISGQFAQAINGAYCSSKFAVEALSDALRMELRQFNIQSTVIEPGPIETKFFNTLGKNSDPLMLNENSAYRNFYKSDIINRANQNRTDTKIAAEQIVKAIGSIKLKPRYKVAVPAKFRIVAALPDVLREIIIKR